MDITLVYFIYGLAFFSMGIAMFLESNRSPRLAEARVLRPLAFFGFIHGSHEWLEMFLDKSEWLVFRNPLFVGWLRVGLLTASFTLLIIFGLQMLQPTRKYSRKEIALFTAIFFLYLLLILIITLAAYSYHDDWLYHIDAAARISLGVVGASLAGFALLRRTNQEVRQGNRQLASSLRWAGWGFCLYALTQAVVPPLDTFPANVLNTSIFIGLTGIPIQVFRAVLAGVITWSLIWAVQQVERERQMQYLIAQQARVEALERVQQEMDEREALRQELLRRIVLAQEEERFRIAHELHDETAQVLTAFSLHLAALRDKYQQQPEMVDRIHRLQKLSDQMSIGINNLVRNLRPAQLDDLGLISALKYQLDVLRKGMNLDVSLLMKGERRRLDPIMETVLFRVAQEALTNVARHAHVEQAEIQIDFAPDQVTMQVRDQGIGFLVEKESLPLHGVGIAGMRERIETLGGEFQLHSKINQGTLVSVRVPIGTAPDIERENHQRIGEVQ